MNQVEAVFENGVFRPLRPVTLPENLRVTVTIRDEAVESDGVESQFPLSEDRWKAFCDALDAPPKKIPALGKLLTEPGAFDGNGHAAS